jgi:hypothetical protein
MSGQAHDLGVQKRERGQQALPKDRLRWLRAKCQHPGPLPSILADFNEWLKAGKPGRV